MRNTGIDFLRGFAAFMIVGCHLPLDNYTPVAEWLRCFCDMNVGVFAALAGYFMPEIFSVWFGYAKKRFCRLVPVYCFWTLIYLAFAAGFQHCVYGAVKSRYGDPWFWVTTVFWGAAGVQLWFLPSLLYSQMLYSAVKSRVPWLVQLCLSFGLVVYSTSAGNWYATYPVRLLSFLILGNVLRKILKEDVKYKTILKAAVLLGLGAKFAFRYYGFGFVGDWIAVPFVVILFFMMDFSRIARVSSLLGTTSMGVYLVHPLMAAALGVVVKRMFVSPFGVVPTLVVWVGAWAMAMFITVMILKIKRLKWIVG